MASERPKRLSKLTREPETEIKKPRNVKPSCSRITTSNICKRVDGFTEFLQQIENHRISTAPSILEFKFNKKRARVLTECKIFPERGKGVVYWTFRDQRVQDNWALLYAQKLALKNEVPLYVCFCRLQKFLDATIRHFDFMFNGLKEVELECEKLNIGFHFLMGAAQDILPDLIVEHDIGAVVVDFFPLREHLMWTEELAKRLPQDVPLIQIDAHNIVPCWIASDKKEYAARTIRNKINSKLDEFLTPFPPVIKNPHELHWKPTPVDWDNVGDTLLVNREIGPIPMISGGYEAGMRTLFEFIENRLQHYSDQRNDPNKDVVSGLSPWYHFGQISVQRCILNVKKILPRHKNSIDAFCEESIIRRELSDNFCFYNKKYDSIDGAENWALKTLDDHRKDKRQYIYTNSQLESCKTHDNLWNAAQMQLMDTGKMHGFLRMYWAKKILEWTECPEEALRIAIHFNDKYSLDGRDPNGYVGCMWSICGTHDQGWAERPVFGKIRYMNYDGCKRKFDVDDFVIKIRKQHKNILNS